MPRTRLPVLTRQTVIKAAGIQSASSSPSLSPSPSDSSQSLQDPPSPHSDIATQTKARRKKAERDERKDITLALTEARTYMGGFSRPSELRSSNWYPGGHYLDQNRLYVPPDPDAYHPRTFYILEGRYPVIHHHGRVDAFPTSLGVCPQGALPRLLELANSPSAGKDLLDPMDNARWPWVKPRRRKRVQWWEDGEDPAQIKRQALEGTEHTPAESTPPPASASAPGPGSGSALTRHARQAKPRNVPTELLSLNPALSSDPITQIRAFHSSSVARRPDEDDGKAPPPSSWSRPPRPSQDARDDVVPSYYMERKEQNPGLMHDLDVAAEMRAREEKIPVEVTMEDGSVVHASGFEPPTPETEFHPTAAKVATEEHPMLTTVKQQWHEGDPVEQGTEPITIDPAKEQEWIRKMVESGATNGAVAGVSDLGAGAGRFASVDFVSPDSSTTTSERAKIPASTWHAPPRGTNGTDDPDSVVPTFYIERKKQRASIAERKEEEGDLMYELNAGLLADEVAAQTRGREEKIPVEVTLDDGTVAHPSGFVPPTPETEFHPIAAKPEDSPPRTEWAEVLDRSNSNGSSGEGSSGSPSGTVAGTRGFHTSALAHAQEVSLSAHAPPPPLRAQSLPLVTLTTPVSERRAVYLPTLPSTPFWRPLLTVTVATRPLALSLERLATAGPRGMAYVATIEDDERKDFASFNARMRSLMLERTLALTRSLSELLGGARGGLVGMRLRATDRGRAIGGAGLAEPVPAAARAVKVGVGEWYPYAREVMERVRADAEEGGYAEFVEVFGVDERGRRTDGKAWEGEEEYHAKGAGWVTDLVEREAEAEVD